jgi:hypothetical protein
MKRPLALAPALALLSGCVSFSTMGTARTLPEKRGQVFVSPGYMGLKSFQKDSSGRPLSVAVPTVEVGARYGITDGFELGAKTWLFGAELDGKIALARSPRLDSGLNLSLAPGVSYMQFTSGGAGSTNASYTWVHLPLLIGLGMPGGGELTLGPRVSDMVATTSGHAVNVIWLGGSLGYAIRIGEGMRVLPEMTYAYPAASSTGSSTAVDLAPKGAIVQVGLGFLFGGE